MHKKHIFNTLVIGFISLTTIAEAQDRVFARTYQSNVLNKGNMDIEVWNTYSFGRDAHYTKLKQRIEFEIGVTDKLQTALYLNSTQTSSVQFNDFGAGISTSENEISFSSEWKYKLSDPVANKMGFALYGELTASTAELELEAKLIFDKKINNHLFALNIVGESEFEFEYEYEESKTEIENEVNKLEIDFGYMFLTQKKTGWGIELQNRNAFAEGEWAYSALYAGPTFSYHAAKNWWLIFNAMPQLTNLKKTNTDESLELTSNEKVDCRLLVALTF